MFADKFSVDEEVDKSVSNSLVTNQDFIDQLLEDGAENLTGDYEKVSAAIEQQKRGIRGGIWIDLRRMSGKNAINYYLLFKKYELTPVYFYVSDKDQHMSIWYARGSADRVQAVKNKWIEMTKLSLTADNSLSR